MKLTNLLILIISSFIIVSCGGGANNGTTFAPVSGQSFNGPGSKWNVSFSENGTFSMNEETAGTSIRGVFANLQSGLYELTVLNSSGTGAPASGSKGYGVLIPGTVLLVKPFDDSTYNSTHDKTKLIPMVFSGQCPDQSGTANWVMNSTSTTLNATTSDVFGTFSYDYSAQSITLPTRYTVGGVDQGSQSVGSAPCTNGIMTPTGARMFLTQSGAAIVHLFQNDADSNGTDEGDSDDTFVVGLPADEILNVSDFDGDYVGLVFAKSSTAGATDKGVDELFPVSINLVNGVGTGGQITDPVNNTLSSDTVTVNLSTLNTPSNGFIKGSITDSTGSSGNVYCSAKINVNASGKHFMFCVGQNPGENSKLYNLLLISK